MKSRIAVGTVYKVDVLKFYRGQAPRPHNGVLTDVRVGEVRCAVLRGVRRLRSNRRGKEEVAWRSFLLPFSFIGYLLFPDFHTGNLRLFGASSPSSRASVLHMYNIHGSIPSRGRGRLVAIEILGLLPDSELASANVLHELCALERKECASR